MKKILLIGSLLSLILKLDLEAKVILPNILSDNMVLQQNSNVKLWGKTEANKEVKITPSWDKKTYTVKANSDGKWLAEIKTPQASYNPYSIIFSDEEVTELNNILIGEVWFASGQSNMEMPLNGFWNSPIEGSNESIATSKKWSGIRIATIEKNGQLEIVDDVNGSWKENNPENSQWFTATGYYFAQMMNQVLDIPIGVIHCSWGGSTVEGWLPKDIVKNYSDIDLNKEIRKEEPYDWWHYLSPTIMYNGMLKPLQNYTIKGFLWYQGESNIGKQDTYADRLKTMVELWRKEWGLGNLPFYYVEIAPHDYGNPKETVSAMLREQQYKAQNLIKNSAMVSTNDLVEIDESNNIHPKNKKDIGKRLAYLALTETYGVQGIKAIGPSYKSMKINDKEIILSFNNANDGFNRLDKMKGFEISGKDKQFYPAKAIIVNNTQIKVSSDKVLEPIAVRYGFQNYMPGNVKDLRELPLYPFRTDTWEK